MSKWGFGGKEDKKQEGKQTEALKEAEANVQTAIEKAKLCIHSDMFREMVKEYEEAETLCIRTLYKYVKEECDNAVLGKITRQLLMQLEIIRAFIDKATLNAQEPYGNRRTRIQGRKKD